MPSDAMVDEDALVGRSPAMQEMYKAIGRAASRRANVLICGERGAGKEAVARALYRHSGLGGDRLLKVRCSGASEQEIDALLFDGHGHGQCLRVPGQPADGAILLDDVGRLPLRLQGMLLRLLQEAQQPRIAGESRSGGGIWVIADSDLDMERMVAERKFDAELYCWLKGFSIKVPALRQRGEDIPLLADYFLARLSRRFDREPLRVSSEALALLMRYPWPGNVRELENVLATAARQTVGPTLLPEFLPAEWQGRDAEPQPNGRGSHGGAAAHVDAHDGQAALMEEYVEHLLCGGARGLYSAALAWTERMLLVRVLRYTQGNRSRAATILGITRGCLRNKLRLLRITIRQAVD
jgi:DNA-binding NtrC family response regulator